MKKTLMLYVLPIVLSMTGCAWRDNWPTKNEQYNQLISQAEDEIKLADKAGFLWSNTQHYLQDSEEAKAAADKALENGDNSMADSDFDKAMKLAQQALNQAQLAQQQARANANPVIKY
ncbi:MAG: hypothetical protein ACYC9J_05670 [Sulfuricaulis sp.]